MAVKLYVCYVDENKLPSLRDELSGGIVDGGEIGYVGSTSNGSIYHIGDSTVNVFNNRKESNIRIHATADDKAEEARDIMQRASGLELIKGECWGK